MSARYTLHGIWLSGPAYKVGLMLALAGEKFDYEHVNLRAGEHKQPGFVAKQRYGQVPLLVDTSNGQNLTQSACILEYLADQTGKFGGATAHERQQCREWMFWDFDRLATPIYRMRGQRLGLRSIHQATAEMYVTEGNVALKVLDDHLAGRNWLVGDGLTIADIDIWGVVAYAAAGGFNLAQYANLSAWIARLQAQPGYASAEVLLPKTSKAAA